VEYGIEKVLDPFSALMAIRKARYVQSVVQELQEKEFVYDFKSVSISDNVEQVAEHFRSLLGVTLEDQGTWSSPSNALRGWKDAIERLGIFVLQEGLPEDDISAFCIADQEPYVLLLNSSEHENRRIFSLFHEIGHILLHRSGVCTPDNFSRNSFDYIKIEKFCNQFSAALLVPITGFMANDIVHRLRTISMEQWNSDDVRSLAAYYRVSQEVIYRRFVYAGILNELEYEKRRKELLESFKEYKKLPKKTSDNTAVQKNYQ
jgi:Zn-dependent peptidase ImmA (M78 family)